VSGVAFGLVPASSVARFNAAERLKEGGRTSDTLSYQYQRGKSKKK
jgi:hypothetical protein